MKRSDNRLQAMLQVLVNKTLEEMLDSDEFKNLLLWKVKEATPSHRQLKKLPEAKLDDQDFLAPVETIVRKKTKKAKDTRSERKVRRRKVVKVGYSTGARSAPSSDQSSTNISDEQTNKNAYPEMLEERAPNLPPLMM